MILQRSPRTSSRAKSTLTAILLLVGLVFLWACSPPTTDIGAFGGGQCPGDVAARVVINPHSVNLHVGDSLQLTATIPACLEVGPETFTWASSDTTIASVNPNSGVVQAVRPGTQTITARAHPDSTVIADGSMVVTVTP